MHSDSNSPTPPTQIPFGYCHCGCGQKTKVATKTASRKNTIKGIPNRYIVGHKAPDAGRKAISAESRFWSHVIKTVRCWFWTGELYGGRGYGRIHMKLGGKLVHMTVHRFSWILHNGPIPPGMHVCHDCSKHGELQDNKNCVNPEHLFLSTPREHIEDKIAKGQLATGDRNGSRLYPEKRKRGESNPNSKLSASQVVAMRERYKSGDSMASIARRAGVSGITVARIVSRKQWKHLP